MTKRYIAMPSGEFSDSRLFWYKDFYLLEKTPEFTSWGEGNFCGWYAMEYCKGGILVACLDDDELTPILLKYPYKPEKLCINTMIASEFEAESIEEAFERFRNIVDANYKQSEEKNTCSK